MCTYWCLFFYMYMDFVFKCLFLTENVTKRVIHVHRLYMYIHVCYICVVQSKTWSCWRMWLLCCRCIYMCLLYLCCSLKHDHFEECEYCVIDVYICVYYICVVHSKTWLFKDKGIRIKVFIYLYWSYYSGVSLIRTPSFPSPPLI